MRAKYILTLLAVGLASESVFAADEAVMIVPDYALNYNLFLGLAAVAALLIGGIAYIAKSINELSDSEKYQDKVAANYNELKGKAMSLTVLGGMLLFGNKAMALSLASQKAVKNEPWLLVENTDILWMLLVNLLLAGALVYLAFVFGKLANKSVPVAQLAEYKSKKSPIARLKQALTGAVAVEDEESIVLDHSFDGIRELDNDLPPWWVAMMWATIIFSFIYLGHHHVFKTGDTQIEQYNKAMAKADIETKKYLAKMAMNVDETNATLLTDDKDLSAGGAIFQEMCIVCHSANGEGDIGPNLTDDYWLYSNDVKVVFGTIKNGTANGMPEHGSRLNPIQLQQVASYVLSLPYTEGKEPEGEKMEKM